MDEPRIVGPTLMVPTGGNAVATIPLPGCDPHLEWSLRYGNPEAVRFSAASVVETFEYLLSDNINMTEATRRLRVLRAAVREHVSGVPASEPDDYAQRLAHLGKLAPEDMLCELLAVIHGDGGHHADRHGLPKAVADAEVKWYALGVDSVDGPQASGGSNA